MPDYSKVSETRDVFGELGWIPNFDIKKSKNNDDRHCNYREFFDTTKDYHNEFTSGHISVQDFVKQNAPNTSMASRSGSKTPNGDQ